MTTTSTGKERFEILFDPELLDGIKRAARLITISPSAWIKIHCVAGLHEQGVPWGQDHPQGDQEKAS